MSPARHSSGSAADSIQGDVEDRYGPVMDAFRANFEQHGDVGAACAIYVGGRRVVDLWGGIADARTGARWGPDTGAVIFSCTKGVLAICAYLLVEAGDLELDAPIARYWPEFAALGKGRVTVRDAMSHRSGLPALDRDLSVADVREWDPVISAIAGQRPLFAPDDGYFYHAMTYGWILGEVIRRVTGVTPGQFFRLRLGEPLGLRTWIGLPETERRSVAWMEPPLPDEDSETARAIAAAVEANPLVDRSTTMGAWPFPASDGIVSFNRPDIQAAEIPAANGISTARSLAKLYSACVSATDGEPLLQTRSIEDATRALSWGRPLSGVPDAGARWGTGFQLDSPPNAPMLGPTSFGHAGAGGQLAYADLEHAVGFAFLANQMGGYGDPRARSLSAALARVLRR